MPTWLVFLIVSLTSFTIGGILGHRTLKRDYDKENERVNKSL